MRDLNSHAIPRPVVTRFDWGRRKESVRGDWGAKGNCGDAGPRGEEYNSNLFRQTQKATPAKRYRTELANKAQRLKAKACTKGYLVQEIEDTTSPRLGRGCGIGPIGLENCAGLLGCLAGA